MSPNRIASVHASIHQRQQHHPSSTLQLNYTPLTSTSTNTNTKTTARMRHSIYFLVAYACTATCAAGTPSFRTQFASTTNHRPTNRTPSPHRPAFVSSSTTNNGSRTTERRTRQPLSLAQPLPTLQSYSTTTRLLSSADDATQPTAKGKRGRKSRSEEEDQAEWEILLSTFQMYKAAYGDLKVPSRFVVPAMPPWPEQAWGLKLGQRVASIRSTERFVLHSPSRRATLDSLGFLWRLRAPISDKNTSDVTFEQIYDALAAYRTLVQPDGPLAVPASFVIPADDEAWPAGTRGMPLGKKMPGVRNKGYLDRNEGARERLEGLGFQFDGKAAANDARFQVVYAALVRYRELNGDLAVPQTFVVPGGEDGGEGGEKWEEEMRGLKLGARVNAIRNQGTFVKSNPERRQVLTDMGFEFEPPSEGKKRGRKRKADLEEEGRQKQEPSTDEVDVVDGQDALVDRTVIPSPSETVDPLFGTSAESPTFDDDFFRIRDGEKRAPTWAFEDEEVEQLAALQQQAAEEEYRPPRTLDATLNQAAELAMSVGVLQSYGEEKRVVKGKIDKRFPWFNDDFGDEFVFEDVVDALRTYHEIHGSWDGLDTDEFVVPPPPHLDPNNDPDDPSSMDSEDAVDDFFADDDDLLSSSSDQKIQQLRTLSLQHPWPESLTGLRLGHITRRIRDGSLEVKHLPARKKQLDALSFPWGPDSHFLDIPFEKAMCALFGYYLIRGDLFVTEDFIIPDDVPWPSAFAGYPLGKTVRRFRELQNFFEAYHTEKVRLLRRVEFVWFPELALPLRPEDAEATWEDIVVEGAGHPFFALNEPAVEMIEGLGEEGPGGDGEEGRNKNYYDYDVVREYWEAGDVTDTGKVRAGPKAEWKPAQWLLMSGFEQLSREHEERYGADNSLELIRTMEGFVDGNMTRDEFDDKTTDIFRSFREDQLRKDAVEAGYEIDPDQDMDSIIQMIKDDTNEEDKEFLNDPEFQRLVDEEIALREKRDTFKKAEEVEEEVKVTSAVVEEEIDDDFADEDEEEDFEYKQSNDDDDDDDDDDVEVDDDDKNEDEDTVEDVQFEGEDEEDFGIEEEEL